MKDDSRSKRQDPAVGCLVDAMSMVESRQPCCWLLLFLMTTCLAQFAHAASAPIFDADSSSRETIQNEPPAWETSFSWDTTIARLESTAKQFSDPTRTRIEDQIKELKAARKAKRVKATKDKLPHDAVSMTTPDNKKTKQSKPGLGADEVVWFSWRGFGNPGGVADCLGNPPDANKAKKIQQMRNDYLGVVALHEMVHVGQTIDGNDADSIKKAECEAWKQTVEVMSFYLTEFYTFGGDPCVNAVWSQLVKDAKFSKDVECGGN